MKKLIYLFSIIIILFSSNSYAASPDKALIIGNELYQTDSHLPGASRDVDKMHIMLDGSGFKYDISTAKNLTKQGILDEIRKTFSNNTEDSLSFFSFAGHGHYDPALNMSYIVGIDGGLISVDELETLLSTFKGKFFIILDSCHSGGFIDSQIGVKPMSWGKPDEMSVLKFYSSYNDNVDLDNITNSMLLPFSSRSRGPLVGDKYYVIAAANKDQKSYEINWGGDWGEGGYFTRAIVNGNGYMNQFKADGVLDGIKDEKVYFDELATYAKNNVPKNRSTVNFSNNVENLLVGQMVDVENIRYDVAVNKEWSVLFNAPVNQDSAKSNITLENFNAYVNANIRFSPDSKYAYVKADSLLEDNKYYKLTIKKGLASDSALPLEKDVVLHFYTLNESKRVESLDIVKNGYIEGYTNKTVSEAFSNEKFTYPRFVYEFNKDTGDHLVHFIGNISLNGEVKELTATFLVDVYNKNFVLNYIGIDNVALSEDYKKSLFEYLYN